MRDAQGAPSPDRRLFAWQPDGEPSLALLINNPASTWGRAGLHTGDRLVSIDGQPVANQNDLRGALMRVRIGDTVRVEVQRPNGPFRVTVAVGGYEYPRVRLEEIAGATARQRERRQRWINALP